MLVASAVTDPVTDPVTTDTWLQASGAQRFSVEPKKKVPENPWNALREIESEVSAIPVLAAPNGVSREENSTTKNGRTYRYAYRVTKGGRKKSLGKVGGPRDRDLQLAIRKRNLLIQTDKIRAVIQKAEDMMASLRHEIPASHHPPRDRDAA